jgi:heme/copper-type cytochrome/quinol oxidase subunit 2
MASNRTSQAIMIVISLIIISVVLPIGLAYIGSSATTEVTLANGTAVALNAVVDPTVLTLLTVLMPILAVVGIILYFVPRGRGA